MRLLVGVVARAIVWLCFAVIVGDAAVTLFHRGHGGPTNVRPMPEHDAALFLDS